MLRVVKDRIQDQAIDVKHISMFYMIYDSIYRRLVTHIYDYVAGMGFWKPFDFGIKGPLNKPTPIKYYVFHFDIE